MLSLAQGVSAPCYKIRCEIILFLPLLPEQKAGSSGMKWRQKLNEGITLRSPYKPGAESKEDP